MPSVASVLARMILQESLVFLLIQSIYSLLLAAHPNYFIPMKKKLLLISALVHLLALSGCEKTSVDTQPQPTVLAASAEQTVDFVVERNSLSMWNRQAIETGTGSTISLCRLTFTGEQVAISVDSSPEAGRPTLFLAPALTEQATIKITNGLNEVVFEQNIPAGSAQFNLGSVVFRSAGIYQFDVYTASNANKPRVPRRIHVVQGSCSAIYKS